jgi:hypothetical protein
LDIETAVDILKKYIDKHFSAPESWPINRFRERSYQRHASCELLARLMKEALRIPPWLTDRCVLGPVDIVDGFIYDLDCLLDNAVSTQAIFIFRVARDTAEYIRFMFLEFEQ